MKQQTRTSRRWEAQARIKTPLGPLTAVATRRGLAGLWFDGQAHHPGRIEVPVDPDHAILRGARQQLARYFKSPGAADFDLPLDPGGTAFQQRVWRALRRIPAGQTSTYGAIARKAGVPGAARAAGAAIGRNPLSIVVPCHRVVGKDGSLTGYAGGVSRKRRLLALELERPLRVPR
jgi:methylated-DNA-[protein]-cysteine S-methyltransferase